MNAGLNKKPPKWPLKFLRLFIKGDYLEEIEGDMDEIFQDTLEIHSVKKARLMYTIQVLKLIRPNLLKHLIKTDRFGNYLLVGHYLKVGWRSIRKEKLNSAINISGLTIGLTVCLVLTIFIRYESSFDHFHELANKTYRVVQHTQYPDDELLLNTTAYPLAAALRNDFNQLELVTQTAGPFQRLFSVENEPGDKRLFESDYVLFVDSFYPEVFDLKWMHGDPNTALDQPNAVVLTERIAKLFFQGETDVIGKTILLNSKDALIVTGIVEDVPGNSNLRYEVMVPYDFFKIHNEYFANNWSGNYGGTTFVVLPDDKAGAFEASVKTWKTKYLDAEDDEKINYYLQPLAEIHTESLYGSSIGSYTMPKNIIQAAKFVAFFILTIAIVNFVNLVTARAGTRSKEVGIRKVIGSSKSGLVKQFILENTILIMITLGLSVGATQLILDSLNTYLTTINLQLTLGWSDVGLILLIGFATVLLATVYPALVLSAFRPIQALKSEIAIKGTNLRKSLTVFQFTIVQIFLIASIVVYHQISFFKSQDLGFQSEAILMTPVPNLEGLEVFKSSLSATSAFGAFTIGSGPPMAVDGRQLGTTYWLPHLSEAEGFHAEMKIGEENYLDFFDLKLVAGRAFRDNPLRFTEFIVNEATLKPFNWTSDEAIGKKIRINEGDGTIVGVVSDYHNNSLQNEITPAILINWNYFRDFAFIRNTEINSETLLSLEALWKEAFPNSIFDYGFLDDSIEREYAIESMILNGFTIFSILVILIGSMGLFALMSFITLRKTKEVGIRKVLGASLIQIIAFFSREFVLLIGLAFVIAAPVVFYFMDQWLQDFYHRIDLTIWMFVIGGFSTLIIAAIASFYQIGKSVVANPVESLRSE